MRHAIRRRTAPFHIETTYCPGQLMRRGAKAEWFVVSATVVRKSNDLQMVQLARDARKLLGKPEKYVLHFRKLKLEQRVPFVKLISLAPLRTVNVLVHKPSISNPETFQQQAHKLYRYCTRLLLERVSWLCRDYANGDDCTAGLVFSNRSAMSYDDLRSYLNLLLQQSISNPDIGIHWPAISCGNVRAVNHDKLAGLQIADAVASSMFFAATRRNTERWRIATTASCAKICSARTAALMGMVSKSGVLTTLKKKARCDSEASRIEQTPGSRIPPIPLVCGVTNAVRANSAFEMRGLPATAGTLNDLTLFDRTRSKVWEGLFL
jgi:hypothetical protein